MRVLEEEWYHLDNVAKVFLATHDKRDTRTLRVSCVLKENIDRDLLKKALASTIAIRPQFQVRIRRGIFWHYVETTDVKPNVIEEYGRPCPILYGKNYNGVLHYQVSYYNNRINFDLFHALSDGTGAYEFLNILVKFYLSYKYPGELDNVVVQNGADADSLLQDGFKQFYNKSASLVELDTKRPKKAFQIKGRHLPFYQLQFFEVHLPASKVRQMAKDMQVGLTSYIGARMMMAIQKSMPLASSKKPVTISMPVNLRNYYPSDTNRNFFNNIDISHVFKADETLESIAREYDAAMKTALEPDHIKHQMDHYELLENVVITRLVPLALKQPVVRFFAKKRSKTVSAVLSNLGAMKVPEEIQKYIQYYSAFCAADKLFMTSSTFGDDMVLGISWPYIGTSVIKNFVRGFQKEGIDVRVAATEVVR